MIRLSGYHLLTPGKDRVSRRAHHSAHRETPDHLLTAAVVRFKWLIATDHVPDPPTEREMLETNPAHEVTQPPATAARSDGGVVRPVERPAAPAQREDVGAPGHVPVFVLSWTCHGTELECVFDTGDIKGWHACGKGAKKRLESA